MTCTEPFLISLSPQQAVREFTTKLEAILRERKLSAIALGGTLGAQAQVTDRMRQVRALGTAERKELYLKFRIDDQRQWYSNKAGRSQTSEERWFLAVVCSQLLAALSAVVLVGWPEAPANPISFFSALAAALLAWVQVKRYQELAQSYGQAAHELGLILAQAEYITTDDALSIFVADAENAISREHTMWTARRDVL
jgi:hypothetical protein